MRKPLTYFAGKVGKNDWRMTIVPRLAGVDLGQILDCGDFRYGGPYFIACDHGCAHGPGTHGLKSTPCTVSDVPPRWTIPSLCCGWIRRSELIFAWIDEDTCFGTMVELGWAQMMAKPIYIGFRSKTLSEQMWFAAHGPKTTFAIFDTPISALMQATHEFGVKTRV